MLRLACLCEVEIQDAYLSTVLAIQLVAFPPLGV